MARPKTSGDGFMKVPTKSYESDHDGRNTGKKRKPAATDFAIREQE